MKTIKYIWLLWGVVGFASCSDFLETEPTDFLPIEENFRTDQGLDAVLTGVYDVLGRNTLYGQYYISELATEADEGFHSRDTKRTGPQVYNFAASDPSVANFWKVLYEGVFKANFLLDNLHLATQVTPAFKNQARGEALFLRGYYYFLLVQHFGDVPLRLDAALSLGDLQIPRTPAKDVYAQIIRDMEEAENLVLPITEIGHAGRVSKSAVRGVLARVCLRMAGYPLNDHTKYERASYWAEKVMTDTQAGHDLNPDYTQIFINYAQDLYDIKESIWEVEFWGNGADAYSEMGRIGAYIGIESHGEELGEAYGFINATAKLYRTYDPEDLRRDWCIAPFSYADRFLGGVKTWYIDDIAGQWRRKCGKWRREYETLFPKGTNQTPQNFPLLRYSDVLLMYAEAQNEMHQGPNGENTEKIYRAINDVRRRGYGKLSPDATHLDMYDLSGLSYEEFRQAIVDERTRELCFEGMRKQDLIRWGIFRQVIGETEALISEERSGVHYLFGFSNVRDKHLLFPIPSREMSINKALKQNEGW